jgi:hypothetical protein
MSRARAIVLQAPLQDASALPGFVETCLKDRVELIAVVGPDCEALEDEIDWLIVGDGSDDSRFILTSSHAEETLAEAVAFANGWTLHDGSYGKAEVVRL